MGRQFGVFIGEAGLNESVLSGVDWKGIIVDIGGSHGTAMIDVLNQKHHNVDKVVIQDLPEVVEAGLQRVPKDLLDTGKIEFQPQYVEPVNFSRDPTDRMQRLLQTSVAAGRRLLPLVELSQPEQQVQCPDSSQHYSSNAARNKGDCE